MKLCWDREVLGMDLRLMPAMVRGAAGLLVLGLALVVGVLAARMCTGVTVSLLERFVRMLMVLGSCVVRMSSSFMMSHRSGDVAFGGSMMCRGLMRGAVSCALCGHNGTSFC